MSDAEYGNLLARMREANSSVKTARERVKTASSAEELTNRGDLLANAISKMASELEERIDPQTVTARKEAAVKEAAAKEAPATSEAPVEDAVQTEQPAADAGEVKQAAEEPTQLAPASVLLANPLVKQGFDSYMAEHENEFRRCIGVVMSSAAIL